MMSPRSNRGELKRQRQTTRKRQGAVTSGIDALGSRVLEVVYEQDAAHGKRLGQTVLRLLRTKRVTVSSRDADALTKIFNDALKQQPNRNVAVKMKRLNATHATVSLRESKRSLTTTPNQGEVQLTITPAPAPTLDVSEYSELLDDLDLGDSIDEENRPVMRQLERAAAARRALAREFPLLTSRQVADFADSSAKNRASTAHRWESAQKVFAVSTGEGERFPAFEFKDGSPREVTQDILKAFEDKVTGWSLALWFISANGWLDGDRPVDVLDRDPGAVVQAAERTASEIL